MLAEDSWRNPSMRYDFIAIPDSDVPQAVDPTFQHVVTTYASETNKTVSVWRAVPDNLLDFKPHEKVNSIRTILVHQLLSERRFFAQFVGTAEPPAGEANSSTWSPRCVFEPPVLVFALPCTSTTASSAHLPCSGRRR